MKKRKGGLWQRMMAVLLSAVLITGMVSNAVPVTVLAQEDGEHAQGTTNPETQKTDKPADSENTIPKDSDTGKPADSENTNPEDTDKDKPDGSENLNPGQPETGTPNGSENLNPGQPETGTPDDSENTNPEEPKDPDTEDKKDDTTEEPGSGTEQPDAGTGQETPEPGKEEETEPGTVSGNDAETKPVAAPQIMMMAAAVQADNIASGEGWALDADGRLTITSDIGMTAWIASRYTTHNGMPYNLLVTSAEITGVTGIGKDAFLACSNLTGSITLPEGVTSIGENAFNNCPKLTGITIPGNVTDIGKTAFAGCAGLTGITIPGSVTSIGDSAFATCEGLTSITIPDTVTSMGNNMFGGCSNLTSVTLPNNMTGIGDYMFCECSSLTSITIPQNVTAIGTSAFSGCEGLREITVPGMVTQIGNFAFAGCASLEGITFLSDTPPTLGGDVFGYDYGGNADNRCGFVKSGQQGIHVPDGKAKTYKTADKGWSVWADYIADNDTPAEKHEHNDVTFTAWTATDSLPDTDGNYYLTENVTLSETWDVPSGTTSLCLNGKTIVIGAVSGDNNSLITIAESCTLNLYDCQNTGSITGGERRGAFNKGTFNLYGGNISGNGNGFIDGGGVLNKGTFNMYGGKISNNVAKYGGGVDVSGGSFNMCGGKINGNTANWGGGGVRVQKATFSMYGGEISGNRYGGVGSGVYMQSEGVVLVGGQAIISGNADNVCLHDEQTVMIDDDNPLSGSANISVTTETAPTEGNPVNITGANSADYSRYFHSDNADYEIKNGKNNEVQLVIKAAEHVHSLSTEWSSDSEGHWHSCSGCEEKPDYASHVYDNDSDTDCITCGYQRTTAAHVHNLTLTPAKDATCTEDGNKAYYICSGENGCDKWFSDEEGTQEIANHSSVIIPAAGHSYDESAWGYQGADGHAHKCQNCDAHDTVQAHTPGAAATKKTPQTCTVCGYVIKKATGGGDKDDKHDDDRNGDNGDPGDNLGEDNGGGNPGDGSSGGNQGDSGSGSGTGAAAAKPGSSGTGKPRVKQEKEGNIRKEVQVEGAETLDAAVATPISELADIVLTTEEKQQAASGTNIRIVLEVKDAPAAVSTADKALVESALNSSAAKGYTLGQYLDINLYKVVGDSRSAITETNRKITITIDVPDNLKNTDRTKTRTFAVICAHDSRAELLADLDVNIDTITIETDRFSTYAIVYKDTAGGNGNSSQSGNGKPGVVRVSTKSDGRNPSGGKDNEPKTGDRTPIELSATLAMIAGLTYLLLYFADRRHGMTEETKKALVSRLVAWAKQGGKGRTYLALAAIFVLLVYYHSIGKKMCVEWEEIYGE